MKRLPILTLAFGLTLWSSCQKEDSCNCSPLPPYPQSYSFDNVDHSGQDARLDMLSEITSYVKTANKGAVLNSDQLLNMFANDGYTWNNASLNNVTKDIASKLAPTAQDAISGWIEEIEVASQSTMAGSNGTAGIVSSNSGTKQYLFNAKGFELAQLIEKGAMGALAYYQATAIYLGEDKMNVDNTNVQPGKGTDMQHHWDEAFGYWGVPTSFGTPGFTYDETADYHRFWAKYTHSLDEALGTSSQLMQAFIKGRQAINDENYAVRDIAIAEVRDTWETVCAGMAIHYLNGAKADIADNALRNHQLSEAYAFIWSLQFNPATRMTGTEIENDILPVYFDNLYEVSVADLNTVRDLIAVRYNLTAVKETL